MSLHYSCKYNEITASTNQCAYVIANCHNKGIVNFYYTEYCLFGNRLWINMILGVIITSICFYLLYLAAEKFLVPLVNQVAFKM